MLTKCQYTQTVSTADQIVLSKVYTQQVVPIRKKSILNISLEENTYQFDRVPTANEPYVSLEGDHVDT